MSYLLEAGVHFGHQTKRWNPKMKEYIFTSRDDIYIIDLEKTAECIEKAYVEIKKIAAMLKNSIISYYGYRKLLEICNQEKQNKGNADRPHVAGKAFRPPLRTEVEQAKHQIRQRHRHH